MGTESKNLLEINYMNSMRRNHCEENDQQKRFVHQFFVRLYSLMVVRFFLIKLCYCIGNIDRKRFMQLFDFHGTQMTIIPIITAVKRNIEMSKTWYHCEGNV